MNKRTVLEVSIVLSGLIAFIIAAVWTRNPWESLAIGLSVVLLARIVGWMIGMP